MQKYLKKILRKSYPDLKSSPDYLLGRLHILFIVGTLKKFNLQFLKFFFNSIPYLRNISYKLPLLQITPKLLLSYKNFY